MNIRAISKSVGKYLFLVFLALTPAWLVAAVCLPPGVWVVTAIFGTCHIYDQVGTTTLEMKSGSLRMKIFKKPSRPFLLVGPVRVDDIYDFFFVTPDSVIRTATDKGSSWQIVGPKLLLNDDLSNYWNCLRAPFWYEARREDGSISYDADRGAYVFQMRLNNHTEAATLSVPTCYFTPDMPSRDSSNDH